MKGASIQPTTHLALQSAGALTPDHIGRIAPLRSEDCP